MRTWDGPLVASADTDRGWPADAPLMDGIAPFSRASYGLEGIPLRAGGGIKVVAGVGLEGEVTFDRDLPIVEEALAAIFRVGDALTDRC